MFRIGFLEDLMKMLEIGNMETNDRRQQRVYDRVEFEYFGFVREPRERMLSAYFDVFRYNCSEAWAEYLQSASSTSQNEKLVQLLSRQDARI